jgi:hypothetical protein
VRVSVIIKALSAGLSEFIYVFCDEVY